MDNVSKFIEFLNSSTNAYEACASLKKMLLNEG